VRRAARWAGAVTATLAAVLALAAIAAWLVLRASLPPLDGRVPLRAVAAPVTIDRDGAGVVTLTGRSRGDLAFALGYVHGQDRFFQMDLLRRAAAGELSALLGPSLVSSDRDLRRHRFRQVARSAIAALDSSQRALLDAYVAGVNAGLDSLASRPFEYWLLGARPRPWTGEDTVLCVHAMFLQLQDDSGHLQLQRGLLRAALPPGLWRFIESPAADWDAAVDGTRSEEPPIPDAAEVDLRALGDLPVQPPDGASQPSDPAGSNNWAVAGSRTAGGAALVANDMHLDFRVPNIWYRARLVDSTDGLDVVGVTLPGTPSIVAGSNRRIAWGFTNSYAEFSQVIRLVPVPGDAGSYATPAGPERLEHVEETIEVKGAPSIRLDVATTRWGPVMGSDWEGRPYVLEWTAHDPAAVNLELMRLERARTAEEALRAAASFGIPGQNLAVADADGHIGWTIAGRLPRRRSPGIPQLSTDPAAGFDGWIDARDQPRILDPPEGLVWSANARVVGGDFATLIGDGGMDRGARSAQIHADLASTGTGITPLASLRVQLDDRAVFLERWRALLEQVIDRAGARADQKAAREVLRRWSGHAGPDDAAYRLTYAFRHEVERRAFYMLVARARLEAPDFEFEIPPSFEGPLWRLVQERPPNLLAASYPDWDRFLLDAALAGEKLPRPCTSLAACTWATVNAVHARHPLSGALPWLSPLLDMPIVRPPGGRHDMPRIQGPDYGASERFSVSPGREQEGYFHMPGGQSGHPLSPFYRSGFDAWAAGIPTPLLPGPPVHEIVLAPSAAR
jgi:penicillin G amidase